MVFMERDKQQPVSVRVNLRFDVTRDILEDVMCQGRRAQSKQLLNNV